MDNIQLTDMDMEKTDDNSIRENYIDKVVTATPEKQPEKKTQTGDKPSQDKNEKKLAKKDKKKQEQYEKLNRKLVKLVMKQEKAASKRDRKQDLSRELAVLIDRAVKLKLNRKHISGLKKISNGITSDIKRSAANDKLEKKIRNTEKKIARIKEKIT